MWIRILAVLVITFPAAFAADSPVKPAIRNGAQIVNTPYTEQKVVFDFYFDHPHKVEPAIQWVQALMKPLLSEPFNYLPEFLDIKVVIHGTEIVTLAKGNYKEYQTAVERMRYFASIGVDFLVCAMALEEYGYRPEDLQDFVKIVPSAITELAHWQLKGFALIQPQIMFKQHAIEDIR